MLPSPVPKSHGAVSPTSTPVGSNVRNTSRGGLPRGSPPAAVPFTCGSPTLGLHPGAIRMRLAEGEYFNPPSPRAVDPRVFEPISETESEDSVEEDAAMERECEKTGEEPQRRSAAEEKRKKEGEEQGVMTSVVEESRGGREDDLEYSEMEEEYSEDMSKGEAGGVISKSSRYSPLPYDQFFQESKDISISGTGDKFHVYMAGTQGPVIFCIHGGGYSGLSWACAALRMKHKARIVAMDMRGHGRTQTSNDNDLSAETLVGDVVDVIKNMYGETVPALVLVGHSMGGAIAVRVAARRVLPSLAGVIVVDVVEGTAMASLAYMQAVLANRPRHFQTVEKAIEWSVIGGAIRNVESARVSIPSQLQRESNQRWTWKGRLEESETHWKGWYDGLSETFLACPVPKLLLLAGTDRLDRALTIAQMQGKFQMLVLRNCGHAIQEDEPDQFADAVLAFISRNRIGGPGIDIAAIRQRFSFGREGGMGGPERSSSEQ